ncbi:MAG TPA: hypothetical protein VL100_14820 [Croceibacterium sp.]|nr:hypothetical protein [Croceibacterium sp.]
MQSYETEVNPKSSSEPEFDAGELIPNRKGHDDSIIIVASYVYEVLGLTDE